MFISVLIPSSPGHWKHYYSLKLRNGPSCREPCRGEPVLANSHSVCVHTPPASNTALSWTSFLLVLVTEQESDTHGNVGAGEQEIQEQRREDAGLMD